MLPDDPLRPRVAAALRRLRAHFDVLDSELPKPLQRSDGVRRSGPLASGHPAEWASDMKTLCVQQATAWADNVFDVLARSSYEPDPRQAERVRFETAVGYLQLVLPEWLRLDVGREVIWPELRDLNRRIAAGLGETAVVARVQAECVQCGFRALVRVTVRVDRDGYPAEDLIECQNCGRSVTADHYQVLARLSVTHQFDKRLRRWEAGIAGYDQV